MTGCGSPTPSRRSTCCPMPRRLRGPERMTRPHSSRRWAGPAVALAADYAEDGVHLLGINSTDAPGAAQAFERTFEIPYPSVYDADGAAVAALQGVVPVQAVPTTVLLDRDGMVAARILGR